MSTCCRLICSPAWPRHGHVGYLSRDIPSKHANMVMAAVSELWVNPHLSHTGQQHTAVHPYLPTVGLYGHVCWHIIYNKERPGWGHSRVWAYCGIHGRGFSVLGFYFYFVKSPFDSRFAAHLNLLSLLCLTLSIQRWTVFPSLFLFRFSSGSLL